MQGLSGGSSGQGRSLCRGVTGCVETVFLADRPAGVKAPMGDNGWDGVGGGENQKEEGRTVRESLRPPTDMT